MDIFHKINKFALSVISFLRLSGEKLRILKNDGSSRDNGGGGGVHFEQIRHYPLSAENNYLKEDLSSHENNIQVLWFCLVFWRSFLWCFLSLIIIVNFCRGGGRKVGKGGLFPLGGEVQKLL